MELSSVIGCDEVGRGCLIESVVAGAVLWEPHYSFEGLNDSKKLTLKQREELYQSFVNSNLVFATGSANIQEIDERNIFYATRLAIQRAIFEVLSKLQTAGKTISNTVLIDGKLFNRKQLLDIPLRCQIWVPKGDEKVPAIMAASIVAKVLRDRYIKSLVDQFPEYEKYGWRTNIGYGTKKHVEAIKKYGITPLHRKTFDPIKTWLKEGIINVKN